MAGVRARSDGGGFQGPAAEGDRPEGGGSGESGQAAQVIDGAFEDESSEQVLIQSSELTAGDAQFKAAVADVTERLEEYEWRGRRRRSLPGGGQISADGHSALVMFELPGDQHDQEDGRGLTGHRESGRRGPPAAADRAGGRRQHHQGDARPVKRGDGQVHPAHPPAHADHPGIHLRRADGGGHPGAAGAHERGGHARAARTGQPARAC